MCPGNPRASLLQYLKTWLVPAQPVPQQQEILLKGNSLEIPVAMLPVQLSLGHHAHKLVLTTDYPLSSPDQPPRGFLILDPDQYHTRISGFIRLDPMASLTLGRHSSQQHHLLGLPEGIHKRHASLQHTGQVIQIKDFGEGTLVALLRQDHERYQLASQRLQKLTRLAAILGEPLAPLDQPAALTLLEQVNAMSWDPTLRPRNDRGLPGGLVRIPPEITPILLGDLHTRLDNLLTILTVNGFLTALEKGEACLILLGDSVHGEQDALLAEMDSSCQIMDLIFRLMIRFPQQVIYLRGNHDSFGAEVSKAGIPQGLLWENHLKATRGETYLAAMRHFYDQLPVLAHGHDFITCHGAPPNTAIDPDMIVNIYKYPGLARVLIWNRVYRPNFPGGYTARDVRRLRENFQLPPTTPLIVAHTPLQREKTVWTHILGIEHHHIVYSGRMNQVALFTRVHGNILPMVYPVDPLTTLLARQNQDQFP